MKIPSLLAVALLTLAGPAAAQTSFTAGSGTTGPLRPGQQVRGWTLLSESEPDALAVIAAASEYHIDHLQLSDHIVMDLREVKDDGTRDLVNRLTDAAHEAGIQEVVVWDHALYDLDYYPARFRTGPDSTLDLDNPRFWEWFKQDYRDMLDRIPNVDGVVLTFIETGARAEDQYSTRMTTPEEKLAAVVNAVADVVIGERHLNLYARTFAYSKEEYRNITRAVAGFDRPEVRLMMKAMPHDFFLTHPNNFFAGTIARPTIIEFDATGEYNGQGLIANTWPQYFIGRWSDLMARPHVIGYTARTDRYGHTRIVGRPSEINLLALARYTEDQSVTADEVYDEFITAHYGAAALPYVKPAFENAFDIVTSTLYTLGTNMAKHSRLDYDPYSSSYARSVSGKWLDPPIAHVGHGVNRDLHYWSDVINHLAPPWAKSLDHGAQWDEVPWVIENGWITPGEEMNEEYLRYIVTEKNYGVKKAEASLASIERGKAVLDPADYRDLDAYFERTLLTARLYRAVAEAYFGFRVYARGERFRTPWVMRTVRAGLNEIQEVAPLIRDYPVKPPVGQWDWAADAPTALEYYDQITNGWPAETHGFTNPYGGMSFPLQ